MIFQSVPLMTAVDLAIIVLMAMASVRVWRSLHKARMDRASYLGQVMVFSGG